MKTVKVEVDVPVGNYCDGCPLMIMSVILVNRTCNYLHNILKTEGDFAQKTIKDKNCPALKILTLIKSKDILNKDSVKPTRDEYLKGIMEHK